LRDNRRSNAARSDGFETQYNSIEDVVEE